jgi:hypothetical protein
MSSNPKFEILALDTLEKSVIKSEINLLYSLLSNGSLWQQPSIDQQNLRINDGNTEIEAKRVKSDVDADAELNKAFLVMVTGPYDWLEPKRKIIIEFLKNQEFNYLYVLSDQISERISCELYPLIYKVENALRAYIVRFMTTRIGPRWWEITATSDLIQKVKNRKNNEKEFAHFIDNNAYLIDFGDLGKLIYEHSSGFRSKEEIIRKISELDETPEAIRKFKEDLKSNYQKFFSESFKNQGFQSKWEELEKIRHKVAHNNLFTNSDLEKGRQLYEELICIIKTATQKVDQITLDSEEREAIRESFVDRGILTDITEFEFLEELRQQELYYSNLNNGFVGLANFVKIHLNGKGYNMTSTYGLIDELVQQGKIEVYYVDNPYSENKTAAIKLLR